MTWLWDAVLLLNMEDQFHGPTNWELLLKRLGADSQI
jgi:hypothetical protein